MKNTIESNLKAGVNGSKVVEKGGGETLEAFMAEGTTALGLERQVGISKQTRPEVGKGQIVFQVKEPSHSKAKVRESHT